MLAIQSGIAKYRCLYTQGAVAFQTPGLFLDSPGIKMKIFHSKIDQLQTLINSVSLIVSNKGSFHFSRLNKSASMPISDGQLEITKRKLILQSRVQT